MVVLLLFESSAETVHTGMTVKEKRAGVVGDAVPVGVNEDRRRGQLGKTLPHDGFHGRSKDERDALVEKGDDGPYPLRHVAQKFPAIGEISQDCLLYTSPSPRDKRQSRMPSSA